MAAKTLITTPNEGLNSNTPGVEKEKPIDKVLL